MPRENYRVIHVMSSFEGGGMEQFVLRLAEFQKRRGMDARVAGLRGGKLLDVAEKKGLETVVLGTPPAPISGTLGWLEEAAPGVVHRGSVAAFRIADCAAYFARSRPDIVHCHNPTSLHYASIGKLASGARLVFTDHAQGNGIIRKGTRFEWSLVSEFVSVSGHTRAHAGDIGWNRDASVIFNGAEFTPATRTRAEMRRELGLSDDALVGINVGSFYPVKAQEILVLACAKLRDAGIKTTMLFLGDGYERTRVEALAKEHGLGPAEVRFLGFRKDVTNVLDASDYFVLCSRSEGLPMSILEAMSRKLPIVCTPVGGNPELVHEGEHGLHAQVNDPASLAAAITTLAGDPAMRKRFGDSGFHRVTEHFSFEKTTDEYTATYARALQ